MCAYIYIYIYIYFCCATAFVFALHAPSDRMQSSSSRARYTMHAIASPDDYPPESIASLPEQKRQTNLSSKTTILPFRAQKVVFLVCYLYVLHVVLPHELVIVQMFLLEKYNVEGVTDHITLASRRTCMCVFMHACVHHPSFYQLRCP